MSRDIAQELVILRAKNSWTQQQLADKLGTTQRTVAAWEAGVSVPRKTMQVKIAQIFELPDDYFLEETGQDDQSEDRMRSVLGQINDVLTDTGWITSDEDKKHVLRKVQSALTEIGNKIEK